MHGPEDGQQSAPGVMPSLQQGLAILVRYPMQLFPQGGNRVVLGIEGVVHGQQPPLLGAEQEDQAHHHRHRGLVERTLSDPLQQRAPLGAVRPVHGLDQHLHGIAHLLAQLVGHLVLIVHTFQQQRGQGFIFGHAEEAVAAQQRAKDPQGQPLLQPQFRIPGDKARGLSGPGMDQHPLFPVGQQAHRDLRAVEQHHHAGGRGRLPSTAPHGLLQILARGHDLNQEVGQ